MASEDLSQFLRSVDETIAGNERNEAMSHPHLARERIHIMDRVPDILREQNESAYSPTTISIGPLHRGSTQRLQAMEPVKLSYMSALFRRTAEPEETKRVCATAMFQVKEEVRNRYELNYTQNVNCLAEVMLIDGCFILELLFRNCVKDYQDPILYNPIRYYDVRHDLLLLENQIPFFVLQDLFNLTVKKIPNQSNQHYSLTPWLLSFFGDMMGPEICGRVNMESTTTTPYHILHFFHIYYIPPPTDHQYASTFKVEEPTGIKYSATELDLRGVILKAGKKGGNIFDIKLNCRETTFSKKWDLEIPAFSVSYSTESFLRNLIAFELSCPWIGSYFTSFAFLMDLLVNTQEDVELLKEAGIIDNNLGSWEEVAGLFNGICKNAIPRRFLFGEQYNEAKKLCLSGKKVKNKYFRDPWSPIQVVASILGVYISLLQTFLAIRSTYK